MRLEIFPFNLIPRNSRLMLYGFGYAGQNFWWQIDETNYCHIILVVDQNYEKFSDYGVCVNPVEEIYRTEESQYEYVLISILNHRISKEVKNLLVKGGIPEEKIIRIMKPTTVPKGQLEDIFPVIRNQVLYKEKQMAAYLDRYYICRKKSCRYPGIYYPALFLLLENEQDGRQEISERLLTALRYVTHEETKIIVLRLLYDFDCFGRACMEQYVIAVKEMSWQDDTPYGLITDMAALLFEKGLDEAMYPAFYTDQRALYHRLCRYYGLHTPQSREEKKAEKRAVIFCHQFYPDPVVVCAKIVTEYADKISELGYEVSIVVTPALLETDKDHCFLMKEYRHSPEEYFDESRMNGALKDGLTVYHAEGESVKVRLQSIVDIVFEINPAFIIDMADDFAVEICLLQKYFAVLYVPFRLNGTCEEFDAYITQDRGDLMKRNRLYHSIDETKIYEIKRADVIEEVCDIHYTREDMHFRNEDFLICTVGRRLSYEVNEALIEVMCALLEENKSMRWILVGDAPKTPGGQFRKLVKQRQIILWGVEENLSAFYELCDVYLQPKRKGGAHGIRLAMKKGLPVVLLDIPSDIRFLMSGSDTLCDSYREISKCIRKLSMDQEYYQAQSKDVKLRLRNLSAGDGIKDLVLLGERLSVKKDRE